MKYARLIILVVLIILLLIWTSRRVQERFIGSHTIPKIIWTYWDNDTLPEVVQRCVDTWRLHNPSFTVNVLGPSNLRDYMDIDVKSLKFIDGPTRESDAVRIYILEKFGGIWSDATIMLTKPYSFPMTSQYEFIGYYIEGFTSNPDYPVLENWFFATIPHGNFITKWKEAFYGLEELGTVDAGLEYMKERGVDFQKIGIAHYLYMHICAQYVMQKQMTPDEIRTTMYLMKADDGPYKYLTSNSWDSTKAIEELCKGNNITDMIKFRGGERSILMGRKDLADCIFKD